MSSIARITTNQSLRTLSSRIAAVSGTGAIKYDPTGTEARRVFQKGFGFTIEPGVVIRSGVAGYDCAVKIGKYEVPCIVLQTQSSKGFGVSDGNIPIEGSKVFVIIREGSHSLGWIIAVTPNSKITSPNSDKKHQIFNSYPITESDPFDDNAAYHVPYEGKDYLCRVWSNSERYGDILPGESFTVNENNCGTITTMFDVELCGGNSFVRVSKIDDEIKIRSTNFTKWTHHQALKEFNDGGLISAEGKEYSYQGELYGGSDRKSKKIQSPDDIKDLEPRPRVKFWKGFLGNLLSLFVIRARKNKKDSDTGLGSAHISQAGNMMIRMAGGVSLERYDKIPIPQRLKEEWDPEGDKEIETSHSGITPFELTKDPHAVGLLKSSQMAWEQKSMYKRFDELKGDFDTPDELSVKKIKNEDEDPFDSKEINMSEFNGRHAGVFIGPDGSVIIRDAWGSEIVMAGGNICINTQGNILTTSHKDTVMSSGQSVVIKGAKASEITSDEGNVRIHAKILVEIAGGTDKTPGGVLIESLSDGSFVNAPQNGGDKAAIGGVVIKSEKSGVAISGKNTYVSAQNNVLITGGPDGDTRDGSIYINGKHVVASVSKSAALVSKSSACIISDRASGLVSSSGSTVVAGNSAMIINDDKIPIVWAPLKEKPDFSKIKDLFESMQTSKITKPYTVDTIKEKAMFSFRSSKESMTDKGIEPWSPNEEFTIYEPYWHVMHDLGHNLVTTEPVALEVEPVHNSKVWPGSDAFDSGKFAKVSLDMLNVQYSEGCITSKQRDTLKDSIEVQKESFSSFKI